MSEELREKVVARRSSEQLTEIAGEAIEADMDGYLAKLIRADELNRLFAPDLRSVRALTTLLHLASILHLTRRENS